MHAEFRSQSALLEVCFPKDQFGLKVGDDLARDERGIPLQINGEAVKERYPWPKAQFHDGSFVTDDPDYIGMLRKHADNEKNGGLVFYEMSPEAIAGLDNVFPGAKMPEGGLTETDRELLGQLLKFEVKIPPNSEEKVRALFDLTVERFRVHGIQKPPAGSGLRLLRSRVTEMVYRIQEALGDEWRAGDEGSPNPGAGSNASQLSESQSGTA